MMPLSFLDITIVPTVKMTSLVVSTKQSKNAAYHVDDFDICGSLWSGLHLYYPGDLLALSLCLPDRCHDLVLHVDILR
jgi:hypothetical protein